MLLRHTTWSSHVNTYTNLCHVSTPILSLLHLTITYEMGNKFYMLPIQDNPLCHLLEQECKAWTNVHRASHYACLPHDPHLSPLCPITSSVENSEIAGSCGWGMREKNSFTGLPPSVVKKQRIPQVQGSSWEARRVQDAARWTWPCSEKEELCDWHGWDEWEHQTLYPLHQPPQHHSLLKLSGPQLRERESVCQISYDSVGSESLSNS